MLEPAVRPGALAPGSGAAAVKPAFENRSFDQLLADAGQQGAGGTDQPVADEPGGNPLGMLSGLGQIENAGLREVLARARGGGQGNG